MSGIWPGDIQCVAMLTFDVDGVSSWLHRDAGFKSRPSLMSMAEYGPSVATPRILDLLDAHSIKASFYIPGYVAETHVELVREIARRGHEVGHHGYLHESPASVSLEEEQEILEKGINILSEITGEAPRGYRSPGWDLSEHSLELLVSHDFLYDSSLMGDDAPYLVEVNGSGQKMVEIPVQWLLDDAPNFVYAPAANRTGPMRNPDEVYDSWAAEFDGLYRYGRAFTLTMHPQYIGRPGRLLMLERLIGHIRSFPNVEFMRAIDVAQMQCTPWNPAPSVSEFPGQQA
jgi:peptidoglycan-N-acetylglucosamine deacetylase